MDAYCRRKHNEGYNTAGMWYTQYYMTHYTYQSANKIQSKVQEMCREEFDVHLLNTLETWMQKSLLPWAYEMLASHIPNQNGTRDIYAENQLSDTLRHQVYLVAHFSFFIK